MRFVHAALILAVYLLAVLLILRYVNPLRADAQGPAPSMEDQLDQCLANLGAKTTEAASKNYEARKLKERVTQMEAAEKARKDAAKGDADKK